VFLHPQTHEEYALARTERKDGTGAYTGFCLSCRAGVTLEQDLIRRDLTINAMARDEAGVIIDPHGGRADIAARIAAARLAGLCRRPRAHPARGPFCGALRRLFGCAGNPGTDAQQWLPPAKWTRW